MRSFVTLFSTNIEQTIAILLLTKTQIYEKNSKKNPGEFQEIVSKKCITLSRRSGIYFGKSFKNSFEGDLELEIWRVLWKFPRAMIWHLYYRVIHFRISMKLLC